MLHFAAERMRADLSESFFAILKSNWSNLLMLQTIGEPSPQKRYYKNSTLNSFMFY